MLKFTGNCIIFSNKFTNLPIGRFQVNDISFRGAKLERFEVGFIRSPIQKLEI